MAAQEPGKAHTNFDRTRIGALVLAATAAGRDAIALWVHQGLLDRLRLHFMDPALGWLGSANAVLARQPVTWPPEVLLWVLTRTRAALGPRPSGYRDPLALPLTAAENGQQASAEAAELWRWFADRYDLFFTPGFAPEERRRMDRLLPPRPDDPYWALTYDCPLADQLRVALRPWLARPAMVSLLRHCEDLPSGGFELSTWFTRARELVGDTDDDPTATAVLHVLGQTVLTHEPVPYPAYRRGRRAVRLLWAEPATQRLVRGALHAMAVLPHDWVDDLLAELAVKPVLVSPVRDGPRQPLWWNATAALGYRRTRTGKDHLSRLRADRYAR